MLWPFLFALLSIIFGWEYFYETADSFMGYAFSTFFLMFFASLAFGIGFIPGSLIALAIPKHWTGPETTRLASLRDNDGASGRFYLGTGSIDTTQYYFFYKEVGRGYQPDQIEVDDNVTIFEEKREGGELRVYTYKFVSPSLRWIAVDWEKEKYEFVIPEGNLKKNFVL